MAILHNLSFDTINRDCCKGDSVCRTPKGITKNCKLEKEYWVCRQRDGAFTTKLKTFKEERIRKKKLGNSVKQLALKILINGGYGAFGSQYFKYYDPRVAELITAHGRYALFKMQEITAPLGFEIVYGDTDSLFINYVKSSDPSEAISEFQHECTKQLDIEVEHAKTYQTAIMCDKKKHYMGWNGSQGAEPDIVGMEGDKSDRPKWINSVFRQIVRDILTNYRNSNYTPVVSLRKAVSDLQTGNVNPELLRRSLRLSKNPEE
jgi:DNA polymerase elongation subunit (family B)